MHRLLIILVFSITTTTMASACPVGMEKTYLDFGTVGCSDQSGLRLVQGSIQQCPRGFKLESNPMGMEMCTDGRVEAYDVSNGCGQQFYQTIDDHGREMCVDVSGRPVVELRDQLD